MKLNKILQLAFTLSLLGASSTFAGGGIGLAPGDRVIPSAATSRAKSPTLQDPPISSDNEEAVARSVLKGVTDAEAILDIVNSLSEENLRVSLLLEAVLNAETPALERLRLYIELENHSNIYADPEIKDLLSSLKPYFRSIQNT